MLALYSPPFLRSDSNCYLKKKMSSHALLLSAYKNLFQDVFGRNLDPEPQTTTATPMVQQT